jgi:hypothetical protein
MESYRHKQEKVIENADKGMEMLLPGVAEMSAIVLIAITIPNLVS